MSPGPRHHNYRWRRHRRRILPRLPRNLCRVLAVAAVWLMVAPVATYLVSGQAAGPGQSTTPVATSNPSPVPLTATTPQPANTTATTTQPSGVPANSPRWATATVTNNPADVPGSSMVSPKTSDASLSTTEPNGLAGLVTPRNVSFTAVTTAPQGNMPAITPQTVNTGAPTIVKPDPGLPGQEGSHAWYSGQFNVDINADGNPDPVYFVLTVFMSSSSVDFVDLSSDDGIFGETVGGSLSNGTTGTDDDERIVAFMMGSSLVRLGPYYSFLVEFPTGPLATWSQQAKIVASDAAPNDHFGWYALAVSGDTMVVGAIADDNAGGVDAGSAYVFVRSGTTWSQQAKLTASDAQPYDYFGRSVGVSGDTIVVGAAFDDSPSVADTGSAYVFVRSGTTWSQQAKLTASDAAYQDHFGWSVAISGDTIVVGASNDYTTPGGGNAAYVFVRPAGGWSNATQTAKLTASDAEAGDYFGVSVAVYGDTIVVGAFMDDNSGVYNAGGAYVFVRPGGGWADATQTAKLIPSDPDPVEAGWFGWSVGVSGDTIVVGAGADDIAGSTNVGSAYVFVRPAGGWSNATQTAKLTASDWAGMDDFGMSVGISGDTIVVGADADSTAAGVYSGSAYVFVRPAGGWSDGTETARRTGSDAGGYRLGTSVAVDGDTFAIASYYGESAYVFVGSATSAPASVTASTWYVATVTSVDLDGDGSADDTFYAAITDTNSDGLYDRLDLSVGDNVFGEGTLSDAIVDYSASNNTNDERVPAAANVQMGVNTFYFTFDTTPGTVGMTLSSTWWTGTLTLDANLDGDKTDAVDALYYALTDLDSDGVYDRLDLSLGNDTFAQGSNLENALVSTGDDDERLLASQGLAKDVTLGSQLFVVSFVRDTAGASVTADVAIQSKTWYKGAFTVDVDANGAANDTVSFVLSDTDSDGLYDTMDLSTNDTDYGDGDRANQQTGAAEDETMSSGDDVRLGDYHTFTVAFASNPGGVPSVASITSSTWYTGAFTIDSDGDEAADDTAYFVLGDTDSDGRYDTMDIETDDDPGAYYTQGEGALSGQSPRQTGLDDDERLGVGSGGGNTGGSADVRLGLHAFTVAFDNNPAAPADSNDARLTSRWYAGTLGGLPFVQVSPASNGLYTILEFDANASNSYEAGEVLSASPASITVGGSQSTIAWRSNPVIASSATLTATGGGQATANPSNLLSSADSALPSASEVLVQQAEQARKEADAQDAPEVKQLIPARAAEPPPARMTRDINNQPLARDEVVVRLSPNLPDAEKRIRQIAFATGATIIGAVEATRTYQLQYEVGSLAALDSVLERLQGYTGVASASHHYLLDELAVNPNDSQYPGWDDSVADGWDMRIIRLPEAWETTTGTSSVRVAVLDADFDSSHEDLRDNIASISAPKPTKAGGHGTHVSGTICARGNNGVGVAGVVWDCSLSLYDFGGSSPVKAQEAMIVAIQAGARVINMSLQWVDNNQCGTPGTSATAKKVTEINNILVGALDYAKMARKDVLWVFAAGNECRDTKYASPASLVKQYPDNVIVVGSVGPEGNLSSFSNYGDLVSVVAPGEDILSTLPNNSYGVLSGTSMAAPHVSGLAALIISRNPSLSAARVKQCIVDTGWQPSPATQYQLIDAAEAMSCG